MISTITLLLGMTCLYATPLIFGALGGVISERSGVINIGIEGMMTVGAFTGALVGYYSGNPWLGFLAAAVAGGIFSLLHAVASISFKADQTISGIALNLIGPGLSLFFCRIFFSNSTTSLPSRVLPKIFPQNMVKKADGMGNTFKAAVDNLNVDITFIFAVILTIFLWFFLYKTKWGLRIRSVGEHPAAADTLGINVSKIRYGCVILSGVLAGMGGASITLAIISSFSPTAVAGQGFIALAAVIFGKWKPHGAFGACLIFGFTQALVVFLGGGNIGVPTEIIAMLPYIITILILVIFVGKSVAPKADGVPYEKGKR